MRLRVTLLLGMALAAAAPPDAAAEIPIGFANPLTDPMPLSGERNRIAVEMAVRGSERARRRAGRAGEADRRRRRLRPAEVGGRGA